MDRRLWVVIIAVAVVVLAGICSAPAAMLQSAQENDDHVIITSWNRNVDDDLAGYLVYWGTSTQSAALYSAGGNYEFMQDVGVDTFFVIPWPDSVAIYAMVKAYDYAGNISAPSYEAAWAPLAFYDRYPVDEFIDPYDGYGFNRNYGFTRNYKLYDTAWDLNQDGIIDPQDKYLFRKHYGTSID